MTDHGALSDVILRQLQDLSTQSMRRASESLAALLGHPVRLSVSDIRALPKSALPGLVEGSGAVLMAGLGFQIVGEVRGRMIILFPLTTIFRMLQALLGTPGNPRSLSGEEQSAVQEVGNIVASSFLSGLGDLLGKRLMPTPPEFHFDDFPTLMRQVTADLEGQGAEVLVVQALFEDPEQHIEGRFFVLPEVASLAAMFQRAAGDRRAGALRHPRWFPWSRRWRLAPRGCAPCCGTWAASWSPFREGWTAPSSWQWRPSVWERASWRSRACRPWRR